MPPKKQKIYVQGQTALFGMVAQVGELSITLPFVQQRGNVDSWRAFA